MITACTTAGRVGVVEIGLPAHKARGSAVEVMGRLHRKLRTRGGPSLLRAQLLRMLYFCS